MISEKELLALQNGSDVRGVAMEGVAGEPVTLSAETVNRIASAFVAFLAKKTGRRLEDLTIAVGTDSRLTAVALQNAALSAVLGCGAKALDCGMASTPAMFMAILFDETKADGSIMLTASHLPFNRNGMKFFTRDGGLEKAEIKTLLQLAVSCKPHVGQQDKAVSYDLISRYANHLQEKIRQGLQASEDAKPLSGMHIVVDAGNGAGGFFASRVLLPLGADITGSLYLEPDGRFPNHVPNPENEAAMAAIQGAVLQNRANLGLIFDTDVDRMSAVLPDGKEISRNALIAMMAAILAPEYPGGTIVTDSVTSDELTVFLEQELGLKHHRYMRGYKNVIDECIRLNQTGILSPLAIETSGHGALRENYYLDDGAYLAVKLLIAAARMHQSGKPLGTLIAKLGAPAESREFRLAIRAAGDAHAYGAAVLAAFAERAAAAGIPAAQPSYEGVRLLFPQGWALLRMSLHDPNMPLNVEGRTPGSLAVIVCQLKKFLTGFEDLDSSGLNRF